MSLPHHAPSSALCALCASLQHGCLLVGSFYSLQILSILLWDKRLQLLMRQLLTAFEMQQPIHNLINSYREAREPKQVEVDLLPVKHIRHADLKLNHREMAVVQTVQVQIMRVFKMIAGWVFSQLSLSSALELQPWYVSHTQCSSWLVPVFVQSQDRHNDI